MSTVELTELSELIGLSGRSYGLSAKTRQLVTGAARGVLLVLLAVIFGGGFPFLLVISSYLLPAFYAVVIACLVLCFVVEGQVIDNFKSVLPYMAWIVFYCIWGTIVSPYRDLVIVDVLRVLIQTPLIFAALTFTLVDKRYLSRLANLFQVATLINVAICLWELAEPRLISDIAYTLNSNATAFSALRPAGLWSNPDEAAFALIFGLLLSRWSTGLLAWAGRIAAIAGIYITVSRTGVYILVLCGVLYFLFKLKTIRFTSGRLALIFGCLSLIAWIGMVFSATAGPAVADVDVSESWNISRILDFSESASGQQSRVELASVYVDLAVDAPWQGYGILTFQGFQGFIGTYISAFSSQGAHNIYLVVLGETGLYCFAIYVLVLAFGAMQVFNPGIPEAERLVLGLMWLSYLIIGLTWHNGFTAIAGMLYAGLLYHLPSLVGSQKAEIRNQKSDEIRI